MRMAIVLYKGEQAGILTEQDDRTFSFQYEDRWLADTSKPAITLTLPKSSETYRSPFLFPFFFHLLSEGSNKAIVCRSLHIDESDDFGLLLATARYDTIGAVTIQQSNLPS